MESRAAAAAAMNPEETHANVARLGEGYRGKGAWARRPTRVPTREPPAIAAAVAAVAGGAEDDDDDFVAAAARRAGYSRRRPVPLPEEEDLTWGAQQRRASALQELEVGLEAAAHGPPHQGSGRGDGRQDGRDELRTPRSSPSSLATEDVLAYAMEWEGEDGAGGQEDKDDKRASSADPAAFQEAREAARSQLTMGAFFSSMGKAMLQEHEKARKEADHYMTEVTLARQKLLNSDCAVF